MTRARSLSRTQAEGKKNIERIYGALSLDVSGRIILDLCGGTGSWSRPYADAGYDVMIIDPKCGTGDVRLMKLPNHKIHGILAAPPCTVFSMARRKIVTENDLIEGLSVVDACLRLIYAARPAWWALENPRGRLIQYLGVPRLSFQPNEYGNPWTKRTHIWGDFTVPTRHHVEIKIKNWTHIQPGGHSKVAENRAITPSGFAKAFFEANP